MKYSINNKNFKSKEQIKKYFKNIKDKYDDNTLLKKQNEEEYNDVIALFKNHEEYEKKTENMRDILIKRDYYRNKAFYIFKNDGSIEDISYIHSINCIGKTKQQILEKMTVKDLTQALRYCIKPQIYQFRENTNQTSCQLCNSTYKLEVDHIIKFEKIKKDFLRQTNLQIPTSFTDDSETHEHCFKDEDNEFSQAFFLYHSQHAQLRILCRRCNQKLS